MLLISTLLVMLLSESWDQTAGTAPINRSGSNTMAYQPIPFKIAFNKVCKFPFLTTEYSYPFKGERTLLMDGYDTYLVQTFAKALAAEGISISEGEQIRSAKALSGLWMITWNAK
jgi:hypothetical protein